MRSLVYAFFAAVILFCGLAVVDRASGYERLYQVVRVEYMMRFEKFNTGLAYPLMAIKGRENIGQGRPKILVVGDSFVWGEGLTNLNQIWWSIMASELERRGYDCEVVAVGYSGLGTIDELNLLRDTSMLEDIAPDLIVIGYVANDNHDMMIADYFDEEWLNFVINMSQRLSQPRWPDAVFPNLLEFAARKIPEKDVNYNFTYDPMIIEQLEQYDAEAVQPLGVFAQTLDIPLAVIATPEAPRRNFDILYQRTLPLFESAGMPVYNPLDGFIQKYPNPSYSYLAASRVDQHPGPATSWFLGEYAADVLERNYASVLGEKRVEEKVYPIEINDWLPLMLEPRAIEEGPYVSQYSIEYPDQSSEPDFENRNHGNFLTLPLRQKYVKLNFKYPVRLSSVKIEGEDLLSAQVWTLGINEKLGFDDQKARKWTGRDRRAVTSLLISAKTAGGRQATLTITIEGEVAG